ncbi:hypothetical protein HPB47_014676 [Ixodes persulcatus]|uniref:Uncharacterized protein n=1 Tax=Ixodes persulcatus TaxID=34615 RepID=A0AC60QZ00_IXOPE|nr:hypothetical protein HPB47_014676 [Ixodes persulcatus]
MGGKRREQVQHGTIAARPVHPGLGAVLAEVTEDKFPVHEQYLKKCNLHITGSMRTILINWLMQVHARFQLLPETLFLTVSVIDRFLQAESVPHSKLQLVGTASMLLSAKYEEMYTPAVDDFVYVTDGACTKRDVLRMEKIILDRVDWSLGRPIPLHFLRRVSKAGQVDKVQHSLAKYILELSLLCYELSWVRPSEQAAAALCLSLKLWGKDWDPTLTHYGRYSQAQLAPTVAVMAALVLDADKSKHTADPYGPATPTAHRVSGRLQRTPVYRKQGPKWCVASPGGPRRVQTYPGLGSTTRMPFSLDTGSPRTARRGCPLRGSGSVETPLSKHLLSQVPPAGAFRRIVVK